jgi:hypothetical protein
MMLEMRASAAKAVVNCMVVIGREMCMQKIWRDCRERLESK